MIKLLYSFHPSADEQQTDIWLYTYEKWGAAQADKYIDGLHAALSKVALDFSLLRKLHLDFAKNVMFFHYGHHFVFVQEAGRNLFEKIQVLSILHEKMDLPTRLSEQLLDL